MSEISMVERTHPSVFIEEELAARGWSLDRLAQEMGGDFGVNRLAIEMYLAVGPDDPNCRIGEMAGDLARAFGTSVELFQNLERSYLAAFPAESSP